MHATADQLLLVKVSSEAISGTEAMPDFNATFHAQAQEESNLGKYTSRKFATQSFGPQRRLSYGA